MPRALVTGITGQDGSLLAEHLLERGVEVVGMVREEPAEAALLPDLARIAGDVRLVRGELLDPESLRSAVAEANPDDLYHLAAPTFVPASWNEPAVTVRAIAEATAVLLEEALRRDGMRVLVAASSEVFGDAGESPQRESSPMRPRTPYGAAKLAALNLVGQYRRRHGLHACAAIAFNHESERRPARFVTRKVTRAAAEISLGRRSELTLGDLDAVRDWSAARDVVRGFRLVLEHPEPGDYVLAGGRGRTVRELVAAAFAAVGLEADPYVRVDPDLVRPPEDPVPVGDPARARERLGWAAETPFEELIAGMVRADVAALGG